MDNLQFWAVVSRLEAAGLARTAFDASTYTTGILLHPGVNLDTGELPDGVVYETDSVEWGQQTRNGMLCHGSTDPREELDVVFEAGDDDEDLPDWNYYLIDESKWEEDDDENA